MSDLASNLPFYPKLPLHVSNNLGEGNVLLLLRLSNQLSLEVHFSLEDLFLLVLSEQGWSAQLDRLLRLQVFVNANHRLSFVIHLLSLLLFSLVSSLAVDWRKRGRAHDIVERGECNYPAQHHIRLTRVPRLISRKSRFFSPLQNGLESSLWVRIKVQPSSAALPQRCWQTTVDIAALCWVWTESVSLNGSAVARSVVGRRKLGL